MEDGREATGGLSCACPAPAGVRFGLLIALAALVAALLYGSAAGGAFDHDHAAWTALLGRFVHDGLVDYAGLEQGGEADLAAYLRALESVRRTDYESWTREQKLAFWINAYNAHMVRLILDHYPLKSVQDIGILPGAAFRTRSIAMPGLRPGKLSLDDIEHRILRQEFSEPRIHSAIVCASKGCPALRSEAYRAGDLDRQLDEAVRAYIGDGTRNRFDAASNTLYLSSIFKWFREDFERAAGSLPAFVARYAGEPLATALRSGNVRIDFLDYDWSLNGTR